MTRMSSGIGALMIGAPMFFPPRLTRNGASRLPPAFF